MTDPSDLVTIGGSGAVIGGAIMFAVRFLGGRSINALDETLKALKTSIDELGRDIRTLRETDIAQAKDIGALQEGQKSLTARVDGQGKYWHEQFEEHRRLVHERMTQATHAMIEAGEKAAAKGHRK